MTSGAGRQRAVRNRRRNDLNDERGEFDRDHGTTPPASMRPAPGRRSSPRTALWLRLWERTRLAHRPIGRSVDAGRRLDFDGGPGRTLFVSGSPAATPRSRSFATHGDGAVGLFVTNGGALTATARSRSEYGGRRLVDLLGPVGAFGVEADGQFFRRSTSLQQRSRRPARERLDFTPAMAWVRVTEASLRFRDRRAL